MNPWQKNTQATNQRWYRRQNNSCKSLVTKYIEENLWRKSEETHASCLRPFRRDKLLPPLVSTVLPSQLGCPQPDNKAMSQKRLEGGMAVNWRAFVVRNLTLWNNWFSGQLAYILPKNENSTLETAYLKSKRSLPKNHCSGATLVLECKVQSWGKSTHYVFGVEKKG